MSSTQATPEAIEKGKSHAACFNELKRVRKSALYQP
jgi:hypothetical protein